MYLDCCFVTKQGEGSESTVGYTSLLRSTFILFHRITER